jgi:2'-deoxynucleoside 5'-phosphate N-hydrolase
MNVYFACAVTGGRDFEPVFQAIVQALLADGHSVPTASLASPEILALEAAAEPAEVYRRDVAWLQSCNVLVAEVSTPSHGVGYEIGYALGLAKPVLCCHRHDRTVSKMITGNPHPLLQVAGYAHAGQAVEWVRAFLAAHNL